MTGLQKPELYVLGTHLLRAFRTANPNVEPVQIMLNPTVNHSFGVCAYYRSNTIFLDLKACAHVGTAGRAWSYPGYTVDRTPYGVLCHEMGHHVDHAHGRLPGVLSPAAFAHADEPAVSSYPDEYTGTMRVSEWYAEAFRLFLTNPDLLRLVRPRTFEALRDTFVPAETRTWDQVLDADRQRDVARKKIQEAAKRRSSPRARKAAEQKTLF